MKGLCKVRLKKQGRNSEKFIWYVVEQKIQRSEQNTVTHVDNRLPMVISSQVNIQ